MSASASTQRRVPDSLTLSLAVKGPLASLSPALRQRLLDRSPGARPDVRDDVRNIIERVRVQGDSALREYASRYDRAELQDLEVPRAAWQPALDSLPPQLRAALDQAIHNLTVFHRAQLPLPLEVEVAPGIRLRRVAQPLGRAGIYAPGGHAAYPSRVLMGVVPARVAGVGERSDGGELVE